MSDELKQQIIDLSNYYRQHKIAKMVKTHPSFVVEDFSQLLARLQVEIEEAQA